MQNQHILKSVKNSHYLENISLSSSLFLFLRYKHSKSKRSTSITMGSIKSNNDANIDDALLSLIGKHEEKLTECEGKICILENTLAESQATIKEMEHEKKISSLKYELAQTQATIKEKDKDIDSLKHNHSDVKNHIVNDEKNLNKRKLSLPPDEPSARCKADKKENTVVNESLSNEEISDNDKERKTKETKILKTQQRMFLSYFSKPAKASSASSTTRVNETSKQILTNAC